MRRLSERPITYPELVLSGPMGKMLDVLCKGTVPETAQEMAQRTYLLRKMTGHYESNMDALLYWSLLKWRQSHSPVFSLGCDLAWAIAHTDAPMKTFDILPEVPIDGMYVSVPPVIDIGTGDERRRIEGFFLTVNNISVPIDGHISDNPLSEIRSEDLNKYRTCRGITVVGIGEDHAPKLADRIARGEGHLRDDLVLYFNLVPGLPLYVDGVEDTLTRMIANLLYLLQNTAELQEQLEPSRPDIQGPDRKARRERERWQQKGRSACPHRIWDLSGTSRQRVIDPDAPDASEGTTPHAVEGHIVMGHIHKYWVLDPAGQRSLATREVQTKTRGVRQYHLVAKWLQPYTRGEGPVADPKVLMR